MIANDSKLHARVVLIGDSSVGKTSILNQLSDHSFNPYEVNTIGSNYQLFVEDVRGVKVEMQIWDTAGQEKFKSLGPIYFRNASAAIAVYDKTNHQSFDNIGNWIKNFRDVAGEKTTIAVAGNKADLKDACEVSEHEASEWAKTMNFIFMETSALSGVGIRELFSKVAAAIIDNQSSTQKKFTPAFEQKNENNCSC